MPRPLKATISPGDVIALGDIHGCFSLFDQFCNYVKGSGAHVILLGDLIDRGPQSLEVLQRAYNMSQSPEEWGLEQFTVILGNHEYMFLDAISGPFMSTVLWLQNGGEKDHDRVESMGKYADWLRGLPIYTTVGETLFTHAGVYPGEDPADTLRRPQGTAKLVWMREPFLTYGPEFHEWGPYLKEVVFGHTPRGVNPYEIPSGICIDTAAVATGVLTCYNATRKTLWRFYDRVTAPSD
jgi:serine/threonine protein phosphatase 1